MQSVNALAQTDHRSEEPGRRARIPHEQLQRLLDRPAPRHLCGQSIDRDGAIADFLRVRRHVDHETEFLQTLDHHLRIFAPQRTPQDSFAIGQRRQHQRAIGNAFRARHGHFGTDRRGQRNHFDEGRKRHRVK